MKDYDQLIAICAVKDQRIAELESQLSTCRNNALDEAFEVCRKLDIAGFEDADVCANKIRALKGIK